MRDHVASRFSESNNQSVSEMSRPFPLVCPEIDAAEQASVLAVKANRIGGAAATEDILFRSQQLLYVVSANQIPLQINCVMAGSQEPVDFRQNGNLIAAFVQNRSVPIKQLRLFETALRPFPGYDSPRGCYEQRLIAGGKLIDNDPVSLPVINVKFLLVPECVNTAASCEKPLIDSARQEFAVPVQRSSVTAIGLDGPKLFYDGAYGVDPQIRELSAEGAQHNRAAFVAVIIPGGVVSAPQTVILGTVTKENRVRQELDPGVFIVEGRRSLPRRGRRFRTGGKAALCKQGQHRRHYQSPCDPSVFHILSSCLCVKRICYGVPSWRRLDGLSS